MDKEYILSELKRVAAENGGAAPGRGVFQRETGIKQSDWLGRYWVKWGEAVAEAGLRPNELTAAYSKDFVLEKLAAFASELGHIPTNAELRMRTRTDPELPAHTTFSRLGSQAERLLKLADYCKDKYPDVLAMCEATVIPMRPAAPVAEPEFGFVYLIKSGKFYKLGKSNAVGRRERELAIQLPEKSKTVHTIRTDDPAGIEAYWHKRFEAKRMNGEWFNLTADDVAAFRRRKFM
jgi:hypothetical protein